MKTLAVLSALATLALAAPAAEEYADSTRLSPSDFTISQQRDKKSTDLETLPEKAPVPLEGHLSEKTLNQFGPSNVVGRTFSGFKKPIIVKKKIGYHLYRDSDEEQSQADPRESCRKQIKVKLCDDNNSMDKVKSASVDQTHQISESEMEHSINLAKEAVETFQRDLKQMELDSAERNTHTHTALGANTELHKDIEKARLALEYIHRKFKAFDTINEDDKSLNLHLNPLKSDEERTAQWKDAMKQHNNAEIAKNLEDNFKSSVDNDVSKKLKLENTKNSNNEDSDFKATVEDIDPTSNFDTKVENEMTSIVEDKVPKMEIQSDNLIKANTGHEDVFEKEEKMSRMEHFDKKQKEMSEKNAELNKIENINQLTEDKLKSADLTGHNIDHHRMPKSNDEISATGNHADIKLEHNTDHLSSKWARGNDQVTHESNNVNTISSVKSEKDTRSEGLSGEITAHKNKNDKNVDHLDVQHEKTEQKNVELTDDQKIEKSQNNLKALHEETDKQRSMQIPVTSMKSVNPSMTTLRTDSESKDEKTHLFNKDIKIENETPAHRASIDSNRDLLNNMDFTEVSHQMALHEPSLTQQASHILKNEESNLHERLNVPRLQPNSQHLKTMMDFSDNTHQHLNQQLKMASMFDNEQPNINVQFNSPQDFQDQTNVQEITPFRASGDTQSKHINERFNNVHDQDSSPMELHDPLKIRWANENNLNSEMLNAASQLHHEHMRMDGSSQHFNIEKMAPFRNHLTNDQLNLNEQIRAQQRWAQAKNLNTHQSMPINSGFDHLHGHETLLSRHNNQHLMMQEKSNVDNVMQPNSFNQMRGAPKMSLDYMNPNQWSHNQGNFRSSYGPSMGSYGSGGGQTSGGPAVGVFPNANVGNCAVPLLVSCSPSVTSGSLTKAPSSQSGYSSPSYRTEDINFLKKRGIDINEATPGFHLHRLGVKTIGNGPNLILEKKQ